MTVTFIKATNQVGYNVELFTPAKGWRPVPFRAPYIARDLAVKAMEQLQAEAPEREFRVYPALAERA